jgi:hypothetical protein
MYLLKVIKDLLKMKGEMMSNRNSINSNGKTTLVDYRILLDELIDETRRLLIEKKSKKLKKRDEEPLFEQFAYISSLRNAATTEEEYKEVYEILMESIQKFREESA